MSTGLAIELHAHNAIISFRQSNNLDGGPVFEVHDFCSCIDRDKQVAVSTTACRLKSTDGRGYATDLMSIAH